MAMFVGGSGGSTGGAIRIVRWIVVVKAIRRELFTTTHPDAVRPVRLGGHAVDEAAIRGIFGVTVLYAGLFVIGSVLGSTPPGSATNSPPTRPPPPSRPPSGTSVRGSDRWDRSGVTSRSRRSRSC